MTKEEIEKEVQKTRAMNREMTLIEWIDLHCLGMANYVFYADRLFCRPSKRTILQAQKVFNKLEAPLG